MRSRAGFAFRTIFLLFFVYVMAAYPQTTEFNYQGSLKDGANAATGNYDFEFALFDALTAGTQLGSTLSRPGVKVTNGTFAVKLDFGGQFPGANRFLEIHVRTAGSGAFTVLSPRQAVSNAPYSVRSLNAATADSVAAGGIPAGSGNYIQNGTSPQPSSNFNISGSGRADTFDAVTQFNLGGNRVLSNGGNFNVFAGQDSASFNTGSQNAFFGYGSGHFNTVGANNSFFGASAGYNNDQGGNNTYLGASAGFNSFGSLANGNTFVGVSAGSANTSGRGNTMLGFQANSPFPSTIINATAIGSNAFVTQSNSLVLGSINGTNNATADTNVGIGTSAPTERLHVVGNGLFTGNLTVNGTLTASLPAGSSSYVQNGTTTQASTSFNISGNGIIGNRLGVGTAAPNFKVEVIDTSNTGLRVQTNAAGGTVASFGGNGAFQVDAPGVGGGRLQITESGNVGIGTGTPGAKLDVNGTGRFAGNLTLNGSVSLNGNAGQAGQVATSNGSGSAPQWASPTNTLYQLTTITQSTAQITPGSTRTVIPGLSQTVNVTGNAKILVQFGVSAYTGTCIGCSASFGYVDVLADSGIADSITQDMGSNSSAYFSGSWLLSVGPGSHTIQISASSAGPLVNFACGSDCPINHSQLIVQVIPQ